MEEIEILKINKTRAPKKGGLIVLVSKNHNNQIKLAGNIANNRLTFEFKKNIFIHFIYGESNNEKKIKSWENIIPEIKKWGQQNIVIGDLNIIQDPNRDVWRHPKNKVLGDQNRVNTTVTKM